MGNRCSHIAADFWLHFLKVVMCSARSRRDAGRWFAKAAPVSPLISDLFLERVLVRRRRRMDDFRVVVMLACPAARCRVNGSTPVRPRFVNAVSRALCTHASHGKFSTVRMRSCCWINVKAEMGLMPSSRVNTRSDFDFDIHAVRISLARAVIGRLRLRNSFLPLRICR
jgi:hypothetical protein